MKTSKAQKAVELYQDIIDKRYEVLIDSLDFEEAYNAAIDLSFEEITPMINGEFLGYGIHKYCVRKGKYVYSLLHCDEYLECSVYDLPLKSKIWPSVKHIFGNLYRMPYYKVYESINELNGQQKLIFDGLSNIKCLSMNNLYEFYSESSLPEYIKVGICEMVKSVPEYTVINVDVRIDNMGWVGNVPKLFDIFWFN